MIYQSLFEGGAEQIVGRPVPLMTLISTVTYRERELLDEYAAILDRQ